MGYEEHKRHGATRGVKCAVLTISDTRTEETDDSGRDMIERLREGGHIISAYKIVRNDIGTIRDTICELLECADVEAILTTGGTGISKHDVTAEAVEGIVEKELDGFGEIFRHLSYQEIGSGAIMSRAMMGVVNGKAIACLPGSRNAVGLAMGLIVPELGHILWEANRPSSFGSGR
jgi:molybdenum cofactor biosynthesis protein B